MFLGQDRLTLTKENDCLDFIADWVQHMNWSDIKRFTIELNQK